MFCNHCGQSLSDGTKFCSHCGKGCGGKNAPAGDQQLEKKFWYRLLKIVYVLVNLLALVGITASVADEVETLTEVHTALYMVGFGLVGTAIFLEVTRRIVLYLFYARSFLSLRLLKTSVTMVAFGVFLCIMGIPVYYLYSAPTTLEQKSAEEELKKNEAWTLYKQAQIALVGARGAERTCNEVAYERYFESCMRRYRSLKLDFDACRQYSSYTSCIALYDIETGACEPKQTTGAEESAEPLLRFASSGCSDEVKNLEETIKRIETQYPEFVK